MIRVKMFGFDRIVSSAVGKRTVGDLCVLIARLEADGFDITAKILRRLLSDTLGVNQEVRV